MATRERKEDEKRAQQNNASESSDEPVEVYENGTAEQVRQRISEYQRLIGERRELRVGYRRLINDLLGMGIQEDEDGNISHEVAVEQSAEMIMKQLKLVENLYSRVTHTREAALDSQVYRLITANAEQKVHSLDAGLIPFVPEEFAEKLISYLEVDRAEYPDRLPDETWVDIGKKVGMMFKTTPVLNTFSGTFDPEEVKPKEKPKRQARVKTDDSASQKPTVVQQIAQSDNLYEEKTTEEVENVYQTLQNLYRKNENEPLCYFRFVIDPDSFSRTVENMFYTSFLVKDGIAKILYDDFELPVIMPIDKDVKVEESADRFALFMGMNISKWKELKAAFKITKGVISRKKK